jgi:hypothetical protein
VTPSTIARQARSPTRNRAQSHSGALWTTSCRRCAKSPQVRHMSARHAWFRSSIDGRRLRLLLSTCSRNLLAPAPILGLLSRLTLWKYLLCLGSLREERWVRERCSTWSVFSAVRRLNCSGAAIDVRLALPIGHLARRANGFPQARIQPLNAPGPLRTPGASEDRMLAEAPIAQLMHALSIQC